LRDLRPGLRLVLLCVGRAGSCLPLDRVVRLALRPWVTTRADDHDPPALRTATVASLRDLGQVDHVAMVVGITAEPVGPLSRPLGHVHDQAAFPVTPRLAAHAQRGSGSGPGWVRRCHQWRRSRHRARCRGIDIQGVDAGQQEPVMVIEGAQQLGQDALGQSRASAIEGDPITDAEVITSAALRTAGSGQTGAAQRVADLGSTECLSGRRGAKERHGTDYAPPLRRAKPSPNCHRPEMAMSASCATGPALSRATAISGRPVHERVGGAGRAPIRGAGPQRSEDTAPRGRAEPGP